MPNIFSLIGNSWDFYTRHTVLNKIAWWLLILPTVISISISRLLEKYTAGDQGIWLQPEPIIMCGVIIMIAFFFVMLWGSLCILVVGKRLLNSKAGRSRTSFHAVRTEALHFIVPLFLTEVLRTCFTLFWSLLLIVPGIIYSIRTTFYSIILVCEGKMYRTALVRSKDLVKGKTWHVFFYLIGLSFILFSPVAIVAGVLDWAVQTYDPRLNVFADTVYAGLNSIATILYILSLISLFGYLKKRPKLVTPPPLNSSS
jgi:uncharacterized membrane protein